MSITEALTTEDLLTANAKLALRVAELQAERDRAVQAVRGIEAATEALVAEHLRREERLKIELRAARRIIAGLEGLLSDYLGANWRLGEHVARLVAENRALLARPWWRRKR